MLGEIIDDRRQSGGSIAAFQDLDRDGIRLDYALGRKQKPFAPRLVIFQADAARQAGF
jgi:hypothetical protein